MVKKLFVVGGVLYVVRMEIMRRDFHKLIGYFERELEAVEHLQKVVIGMAEEYNYILPMDAVVDLPVMREKADWN